MLVCVHTCMLMHICEPSTCERGNPIPPELELQAAVSCQTRVLGIEPGPSRRAVYILMA